MTHLVRSILFIVLWLPHSGAQAQDSATPEFSQHAGLVDAAQVAPGLLVELKYAGTDNFLKRNLYGDMRKCFLNKDTALMLKKAAGLLHDMRPDLRLLAYDCVRPLRVQRLMFEAVRGTPQQKYVANPDTRTGSMHNYGCAVDLTLASQDGRPLDMGTPFDFFGKRAQPRHEVVLNRTGQLTNAQWANRLLLRQIMVAAGFMPINSEWWHFNCASPARARKRYPKIP